MQTAPVCFSHSDYMGLGFLALEQTEESVFEKRRDHVLFVSRAQAMPRLTSSSKALR